MMDHTEHCALAGELIGQVAAMLVDADLATPVPTCPGWDLSRLVKHLGGVHRWAASMVAVRAPGRLGRPDGERGPDLVAWLAEGSALMTQMAAAPGSDPMWSWGTDQHVAFWSRRMVFETAIHGLDVALSLGRDFAVSAEVAADGIDELLDNLPAAVDFAPQVAALRGQDSLHFHGTDHAAAEWMVQLGPEGFSWQHAHGKASVAVRAATWDLLALLYGRRVVDDERYATFGDLAVLRTWLANSAL
jgi:uncharacterized protein (TIGR03083 family)